MTTGTIAGIAVSAVLFFIAIFACLYMTYRMIAYRNQTEAQKALLNGADPHSQKL